MKHVVVVLILFLIALPVRASDYKTYIISNVVDSNTVVVYDGSYYLVDLGFGCSFGSSDELKGIYIESSLFGGPNTFSAHAIYPDTFGNDTCSVLSSNELNLKQYLVEDVFDSDYKIIVSNSYGSRYLVEYGIGCLSMWRHEDKYINIDIGGSFLDGIGDRIYLFDSDDDCSVLDADSIGSSSILNYSPITSPTSPLTYTCTKYGDNAVLNSSNNTCSCKSGYEWNTAGTSCVQSIICPANSTKQGSQCTCNEGYSSNGNSCITYSAACQATYGTNAYGDKTNCYCNNGFEWNSGRTACVIKPIYISEPAAPPEKTPATIDQTNDQFVQSQIDIQESKDGVLLERLKGRIVLQVESHGEAWYVDPVSKQRFYMRDGNTAYEMLRAFGLGLTNKDLIKLQQGDAALLSKLKGRIVLQVESRGEAYYISPVDGSLHYLKDGDAAYSVMRELSLGIASKDLNRLPIKKFVPIQKQ